MKKVSASRRKLAPPLFADDKVNTRVISPVTALNPSPLEGYTLASCLMRLPRLNQQNRPLFLRQHLKLSFTR